MSPSDDDSSTSNTPGGHPAADAGTQSKTHFRNTAKSTATSDAITEQIEDSYAGTPIVPPLNEVITECTRLYLDVLDPGRAPPARIVERELLIIINSVIKDLNGKAGTAAEKLPMQRHLTCWQVAQVMLRLHHIVRIAPSKKDTDREYDLLAMYVDRGIAVGTHTTSEDDMRTVARKYHNQITLRDFTEITAILREDSRRTHQCAHRDLVALGNGVFHYGTEPLDLTVNEGDDERTLSFTPKTLHPFDPDLVFLSKCAVDYVADAPNPVLTHPDGTEWDVVSWIDDLSDDEGVPDLLWEIIGAIIRPQVRWNQTAWFYSESGNNGKGTLCSLMRNLCGPRAHTSIPLSDFGKDFALEPLVRASAIIVDENDVGTFVDKAANLKAVVTGDVIQINRKYRMPISYQFFGFMVQCLNEFPQVKDKSDSFYRRQLFVPFTKSFTGMERTEIKGDFLQRREVLEYVLWHVLHQAGADAPGEYYQLSQPAVAIDVLDEYKEANDPVRAFWAEFRDRLVWDLLPFTFLYDLYKSWFAEVSPSGSPVSSKRFAADLVAIIDADPLWYCPDKRRKFRPGSMMDDPEPLIADYALAKWLNPTYVGTDRFKRGQYQHTQANYRGLLRHGASSVAQPAQAGPATSTDAPEQD